LKFNDAKEDNNFVYNPIPEEIFLFYNIMQVKIYMDIKFYINQLFLCGLCCNELLSLFLSFVGFIELFSWTIFWSIVWEIRHKIGFRGLDGRSTVLTWWLKSFLANFISDSSQTFSDQRQIYKTVFLIQIFVPYKISRTLEKYC
jgi:hypothetical protein